MYKYFVKRYVCNVYARLNRGEFEFLLDRYDERLAEGHHFAGNHALGGTRFRRKTIRVWFRRLFKLFPNLHFRVRDVSVVGGLRQTKVTVQWEDTATLADGSAYENQGVQLLRLSWGRPIRTEFYMDTQRVADACKRIARCGISEAEAPPLLDEEPATDAPFPVYPGLFTS